ncbi:MAG: hypothetical protein V4629_06835 [Pseudomonadota bacterium]
MQAVQNAYSLNQKQDSHIDIKNQFKNNYLENIEILTEDDLRDIKNGLSTDELRKPSIKSLIIGTHTYINNSAYQAKVQLLKKMNDEIHFFHTKKGMNLVGEKIIYSLIEQLVDVQRIIFLMVNFLSIDEVSKTAGKSHNSEKMYSVYVNSNYDDYFKIDITHEVKIELQNLNLNSPDQSIFLGNILGGFKHFNIDVDIIDLQSCYFSNILKEGISKKLTDELDILATDIGFDNLIQEYMEEYSRIISN